MATFLTFFLYLLNMKKWIYISFIVLTIILYVANINGGYFSDDFTMFFPKGEINIFSLFFSINPYEPSVYRPLAGIYNGIVQYFFGTNAFLIHLMNILLHGIISCVIYNGIIRLNMNKQTAIIGGLLFIISQSTVAVTLRNCTMTQQLSCLFNLLFIYVLVFSEKPKIKRYLILCSLYVWVSFQKKPVLLRSQLLWLSYLLCCVIAEVLLQMELKTRYFKQYHI